jgi:hypothetical protein
MKLEPDRRRTPLQLALLAVALVLGLATSMRVDGKQVEGRVEQLPASLRVVGKPALELKTSPRGQPCSSSQARLHVLFGVVLENRTPAAVQLDFGEAYLRIDGERRAFGRTQLSVDLGKGVKITHQLQSGEQGRLRLSALDVLPARALKQIDRVEVVLPRTGQGLRFSFSGLRRAAAIGLHGRPKEHEWIDEELLLRARGPVRAPPGAPTRGGPPVPVPR